MTLFLEDSIVKRTTFILSFHLFDVLLISATLPDKSAIMEETDQELSRYIDSLLTILRSLILS